MDQRHKNVRSAAVKLLEGNVSSTSLDTGVGNDVLVPTPKAQATKAKLKGGTMSNQFLFSQQRNNQQNEKENYKMGENISKPCT